MVIGTDCTRSGISNYYANMTTRVPIKGYVIFKIIQKCTDLQHGFIHANLQNWNKMCSWQSIFGNYNSICYIIVSWFIIVDNHTTRQRNIKQWVMQYQVGSIMKNNNFVYAAVNHFSCTISSYWIVYNICRLIQLIIIILLCLSLDLNFVFKCE